MGYLRQIEKDESHPIQPLKIKDCILKNTTKLKNILQLYTVTLDLDDENNIQLTTTNKRNNSTTTFIDKAYSIVIGKAFSHMLKEIKKSEKNL